MGRTTIDFTCLVPSDLDIASLADSAAAAVDATLALRDAGTVGFLDLPDDKQVARAVMDYARELPAEVDAMVVLGIGGSSLGPQALYTALAPPFDPLRPRSPGMPRRLFFPDNADPVTFRGLLELLDPKRTVFNVVTKSGGTAETAAQLMIVLDHLERTVGADGIRRHLVATTDPDKGALRELSRDLDLATFGIPASVGGRFSVLSPVGLLPAAVAGLDVSGLLDGARAMRERCLGRDVATNPALLLASLLHWHFATGNRNVVVMMPYADSLFTIGDWFRQLWGESLGKAGAGSTPVVSRGATDQHSQLQLYAEGPDDKVYLFLAPAERGPDLVMPAGRVGERPAYAYLAGHGMGELLDAELRGTQASLTSAGRPNASITLDRVDAPALGELIMLFEAATAFAGPLFGVDPYDQPGVEQAKRLAYGALGRDGFEAEAQQLKDAPAPDPRYVL